MGSNCDPTIDVTHDNECRPTTTETRVAYDNSTWHAMNTTYINSTKETSSDMFIDIKHGRRTPVEMCELVCVCLFVRLVLCFFL